MLWLVLCAVGVAVCGAPEDASHGGGYTHNEQGNWFNAPGTLPLSSVPLWQDPTPANLTCPNCGRKCRHAASLGSHMKACCPELKQASSSTRRRRRYTFREKRAVLLRLDNMRREGHRFAISAMSIEKSISKTTLLTWERERELIFRLAATKHVGGKKSFSHIAPDYPDEEYLLYVRFVWRRQYQKLRVSTRWLRSNMRQILKGSAPPGMGYSRGWVTNFLPSMADHLPVPHQHKTL